MLSNCFLGNYRLMVLNGSNTGGIKTERFRLCSSRIPFSVFSLSMDFLYSSEPICALLSWSRTVRISLLIEETERVTSFPSR